ncbi:MAG: aldo/keto reductase [Solirubrobacteraceae bacterium]
MRYFDTAPAYGAGLSERRVGAALRGRPRDEFVLSTKIGRFLVPGTPDPSFSGTPALAPKVDFSAAGIRQSLEESLERLQLERIDVALIHDPEDHIEAALGAVAILGAYVDTIGVGTKSVDTALTFVNEAAIDCVLIAGRYTLLDDSAGIELLPACARRAQQRPALGWGHIRLRARTSGDDRQAGRARRNLCKLRCATRGRRTAISVQAPGDLERPPGGAVGSRARDGSRPSKAPNSGRALAGKCAAAG